MRGATDALDLRLRPFLYFNPRSSCEERPQLENHGHLQKRISIHAPHARSDRFRLPMRISSHYFNPRSSCEERPKPMPAAPAICIISIHAPHARSDGLPPTHKETDEKFQSTLLMRGATILKSGNRDNLSRISIHAPHARSDDRAPSECVELLEFQSTLLMRGATCVLVATTSSPVFQSTLLMRGATDGRQ